MVYKIGIISDTHGLLRSEAIEKLQGSDIIIHAGDIGDQQILRTLEEIAPVYAVKGNTDNQMWAALNLQETVFIQIENKNIYIIHNVNEIDIDPKAASVDIVISGHSHSPSIQEKNSVLYVNPGSAGPRRFSLPVTLSVIYIKDGTAKAEIVNLLNETG